MLSGVSNEPPETDFSGSEFTLQLFRSDERLLPLALTTSLKKTATNTAQHD
jgi:hypothetical protein